MGTDELGYRWKSIPVSKPPTQEIRGMISRVENATTLDINHIGTFSYIQGLGNIVLVFPFAFRNTPAHLAFEWTRFASFGSDTIRL